MSQTATPYLSVHDELLVAQVVFVLVVFPREFKMSLKHVRTLLRVPVSQELGR